MNGTITCPNCQTEFELTKAISDNIALQALAEERRRHSLEIDQVKLAATEQARKVYAEKSDLELRDLHRTLAEKDKKLADFRDQELKLREQKRLLEEDRKELELAMSKKEDELRVKLSDEIGKKALEDHRLKDAEKDKVINDLKYALEEAQRKASQGSQQLQGEVLELDLESRLAQHFPADQIEPIGKGIRGADIRQTVKSSRGTVCGKILWESKRTKDWQDSWLAKLKEDLRGDGADFAVIVSGVLPKDTKGGMGSADGIVWYCTYPMFYPLAFLLRKNLIDVTRQKVFGLDRNNKSELLYEYITGLDFRQQLERLAESYLEMQSDLNRERATFDRLWKNRELQLRRVFDSAAGLYAGVAASVGSALPTIKAFNLPGLESGEKAG